MSLKHIELLDIADLEANPVWEFANDDASGETLVRSVKQIPAKNLDGKLVGTKIRLANGATTWALVGNIDTEKPRLNEHFLTLSIERDGEWFHLARYHDLDFAIRGPEALSRFLGLPVDEVFPISVDVRPYSEGNPAALANVIQKEPRERLSSAEIITLAVP